MAFPLLGGYVPDRTVAGITSSQDIPESYGIEPESAWVILSREYSTDAHFVTYTPSDPTIPHYGRCNKRGPILQEIRAAGLDLVGAWLVFDVDNPGHEEHKSTSAAHKMVETLWEAETLPFQPHAVYATRAGARLMFAMEHAVPVDELERILAGVHPHIVEGLPDYTVDALFDWSRLFRVPKATREHVKQWDKPWFALRMDVNEERPQLNVASLPRESLSARDGRSHVRNEILDLGERPTHDECSELAYALQQERSDLLAEIRRRLLGRSSESILFGSTQMAPPEGPGRMNAVQRYVGDVCRWLWPVEGMQPEIIYCLFWPEVATWEPDSDTPDWLEELWGAVCRYWSSEYQKDPDPEATRSGIAKVSSDPRLATQQEILSSMAKGVRQWFPQLPEKTNDRDAWILRHLFAIGAKGEVHILGRDGYYGNTIHDNNTLVPAMRDLSLDKVVALQYQTKSGIVYRPYQDLLRDHGTHFGVKRMLSGIVDPSGQPGGRLENIGSDQTVYEFSTFARRSDIAAKFDDDVDRWLKVFAGSNYEKLCRWIAWALAFEEGPICATLLYGRPGAGKKMLMRGLAECITTGEYGTGDDFKKWGYGICNSPFLFVNEDFPEDVGKHGLADTFRQYVDGERIRIELKFMAPFMMCNPLRVLICSNSKSPIERLTGFRDLSPDDREALKQRLQAFYIGPTTPDYLEALGGIEHTKGWVAADSGQGSEGRIAGHFMYLYKNRHQYATDKRFLIEGGESAEVEEEMLMASPGTTHVIEILLALLQKTAPVPDGFLLIDGQMFVTCNRIRQVMLAQPNAKPMNLRSISQILRNMCATDGHSKLHNPDPNGDPLKRARWNRIDLDRMKAFAVQYGIPHDNLDRLMKGEPIKQGPTGIVIPLPEREKKDGAEAGKS